MKRFIAMLQEAFGYSAYVAWEGGVYVHRAWTFDEVLSWAAAYPATATVRIYAGFFFLAERGGVA